MSTSLPPIDPALRIGSVKLAVSDLPRSADFYERVLGLPLISRDEDSVLLGPDGEHPLLALTALADPTTVPPGSTGLFHVAWLHPSRAALAQTVRRIVGERWLLDGASDHGVSEALYLSDPDGLGIEIYADRPRELWERPADEHGVKMVTLPLDLDDLLAESAEASAAMGADAAIGHVHLKVTDVPRASPSTATRSASTSRRGYPPRAFSPPAAITTTSASTHGRARAGGRLPPARRGCAGSMSS
jgi:catechol 2,3-dioxygenase